MISVVLSKKPDNQQIIRIYPTHSLTAKWDVTQVTETDTPQGPGLHTLKG